MRPLYRIQTALIGVVFVLTAGLLYANNLEVMFALSMALYAALTAGFTLFPFSKSLKGRIIQIAFLSLFVFGFLLIAVINAKKESYMLYAVSVSFISFIVSLIRDFLMRDASQARLLASISFLKERLGKKWWKGIGGLFFPLFFPAFIQKLIRTEMKLRVNKKDGENQQHTSSATERLYMSRQQLALMGTIITLTLPLVIFYFSSLLFNLFYMIKGISDISLRADAATVSSDSLTVVLILFVVVFCLGVVTSLGIVLSLLPLSKSIIDGLTIRGAFLFVSLMMIWLVPLSVSDKYDVLPFFLSFLWIITCTSPFLFIVTAIEGFFANTRRKPQPIESV